MWKYLLRKFVYAIHGCYYEEDDNGGYFVVSGNREFGVSGGPSSPEPKD